MIKRGRNSINGIVVWYNPDDKMILNIETYINEVEKLYIVDNSDNSNIEKIKLLKENKKIEYIYYGENKGIAYALNIGLKKGLENEAKYLLTMDQDSYFEENYLERYLNLIEKDIDKAAIYGISALYEKKRNLKQNL